MILKLESVNKIYTSIGKSLTVLSDVNMEVEKGALMSIVGPSGSGKTTLLGLCAGLDNPSNGKITLAGHDITNMTEDEKAQLRNEKIGFIFQNFQLLPTLTALENVMLPLELNKKSKGVKSKAKDLLNRVGLEGRHSHYPSQLSGGEQQRVALARAFINDPEVLFADEPTGNLDTETGELVENLLFELNKELNTTLIIVTHDLELAQKTNRIVRLKSGKIIEDKIISTI